MKYIPLNHGKYAIVGDEDYEELALFKWRATFITGNWYACFHDPEEGSIYMSRYIAGFPDGMVYHVNRDSLDNRKSNFVIHYAKAQKEKS